MSLDSTYTVCGITEDAKGNAKVRWTNDLARRVKLFAKQGAVRVDLVDLPQPMDKLAAIAYIKTLPQFDNAADRATIADAESYRVKVKSIKEGTYVARPRGRPRKYPVGTVVVKASKAKKSMSLADIAARAKTVAE